MNKIYEQLDEIKLLWKQLKHYDIKSSTLSTIENDGHEETEEEILSGPDAVKKLEVFNSILKFYYSQHIIFILKNDLSIKIAI